MDKYKDMDFKYHYDEVLEIPRMIRYKKLIDSNPISIDYVYILMESFKRLNKSKKRANDLIESRVKVKEIEANI